MKIRSALLLPPCAALITFAYACSDDASSGTPSASDAGAKADAAPLVDAALLQDSAPPQKVGPIELKFEARVGAEPFACGKTYAGIGMSSATAAAGDLRFFIHDVRLLRGTEEVPVTLDAIAPWQSSRLALLDFENKTGECEFGTSGTNEVVKGSALGTGFDGIAFKIGVPEDLNHLNKDIQPAPLPGSGLNWDWTNGYIHIAVQLNSMKLESDGVARVPPFYSHVGSTQCSGDPADGGTPGCALKNRPSVRLMGFDPTKNKIVLDAKKLYEGSNIDVNTPDTIPGCMSSPSDPECPAVFTRFGLDFATGLPKGSPAIFSVEPR